MDVTVEPVLKRRRRLTQVISEDAWNSVGRVCGRVGKGAVPRVAKEKGMEGIVAKRSLDQQC